MGSELPERLAAAAQRYQVPGASLAVFDGAGVECAAAGVLNLGTGVAVSADSLFQIGSVTKAYTATLTMQLVEQGRLSLDEPVVGYLPDFQVADPDVTKLVTVRHLLTHTSGIDGDHFHDTGRGDDCLDRYVRSCAELEQLHPLGVTMSYCNTGYSILGRVIETVTGQVWDAALRERLLEPMGVSHTVTLPEEALRFGTAMGHLGKPGELRPAPRWGLSRSVGPAGNICATASDLLTFARLHLDGATVATGEQLLSAATISAMREPQVAVPDRWTFGGHWGLGWILFDWGAGVYGHDGNAIGQSAYLRIAPDAGVAFALLTNGGLASELADDLGRTLLAELAGVDQPHVPVPADPPPAFDPRDYVGRYDRTGLRIDVIAEHGELKLRAAVTGELADLDDSADEWSTLHPVDVESGLFVTREDPAEKWAPAVFFTLADGTRYLHHGARATPRREP